MTADEKHEFDAMAIQVERYRQNVDTLKGSLFLLTVAYEDLMRALGYPAPTGDVLSNARMALSDVDATDQQKGVDA